LGGAGITCSTLWTYGVNLFCAKDLDPYNILQYLTISYNVFSYIHFKWAPFGHQEWSQKTLILH